MDRVNNVIDFPKKHPELQIIAELDSSPELTDEALYAVWLTISGFQSQTDASWRQMFDALVMAAIQCGLQDDVPLEEIERIFNNLNIESGDDGND